MESTCLGSDDLRCTSHDIRSDFFIPQVVGMISHSGRQFVHVYYAHSPCDFCANLRAPLRNHFELVSMIWD